MNDASSTSRVLLEARSIRKQFPGVLALDGVDLTLERGEVLAVVGENGAGKSTLMKILAGVLRSDAGELRIDGQSATIENVRDALHRGIALIHQELNLADNLTVAGNMFLGREPRHLGFIARRQLHHEAGQWLSRLGLDLAPDRQMRGLSIGQQQLVEIAKVLSVGARILIMDEPTSSLSQAETDRLFRTIQELRERGVSIIYISHRLGEVRHVANRVCVLRDGRNAGELGGDTITHEAMVQRMVGRDIAQFYPRADANIGDVILRARGLVTRAHPRHAVDLALRAGEIVGLAGLIGAGRSELLETIFGARAAQAGTLQIRGRTLRRWSPRDVVSAGTALLPEDRKRQGLIMQMSVRHNCSLPSLWRDQRGGFVDFAAERRQTGQTIERLGIRTPSDHQVVHLLSGGNQQKVVLGKWLGTAPRILLLDEPTRGIDVGAKQEIYQQMSRLAGAGVAILFVSSELEEIIGMADRVLVMHDGRIAGELDRSQVSEASIMRLATGG